MIILTVLSECHVQLYILSVDLSINYLYVNLEEMQWNDKYSDSEAITDNHIRSSKNIFDLSDFANEARCKDV